MNYQKITFLIAFTCMLASPIALAQQTRSLAAPANTSLSLQWSIQDGDRGAKTLFVEQGSQFHGRSQQLPNHFRVVDVRESSSGKLLVIGYLNRTMLNELGDLALTGEGPLCLLQYSVGGELLGLNRLSAGRSAVANVPFQEGDSLSKLLNPPLNQALNDEEPDSVTEIIIIYIPASDSGRP